MSHLNRKLVHKAYLSIKDYIQKYIDSVNSIFEIYFTHLN